MSNLEIHKEMQSINFQISYYVGKLYQLHTNVQYDDSWHYSDIRDNMDAMKKDQTSLAELLQSELRNHGKVKALKARNDRQHDRLSKLEEKLSKLEKKLEAMT